METDIALIKDTVNTMNESMAAMGNNLQIVENIVMYAFFIGILFLLIYIVRSFWKMGDKKE